MSIKGLYVTNKKKPGDPVRWYVYAWRGGPQLHVKVGGSRPVLTPEIMAAYHEATLAVRKPDLTTVSGVAADWRASIEWNKYADDTKKQWGAKLALIERKWGDIPLEAFEDRRSKLKIINWRDEMAKTSLRGADMGVQVIRALLEYACKRGLLLNNIAVGIPNLYKGGNRQDIIWTPIERYVMELGLSQQVSDAFRLACLTGFRRAELARCPLSAVGEHAIVWKTQKSRGKTTFTVPMIEPLRDLIEELRTRPRQPGADTILVNSRGQSWTPDGLDSSFGDERNKIGFDKHLHDARGTFVTELCEAGLTDLQIAGIVAWSPTRVADIRRIYVDQARTVVAIGEALSRRTVNRTVNQ